MRTILRLLAVAFAVSLPAAAAHADSKVTPSGTLISKALSADGSVRGFTGSVKPFGPVVGVLTLQVNPDFSFQGQFVLFGKSGAAYGHFVGQFTSANTYFERLFFDGGTGRFDEISGYADVLGSLDASGNGTDVVVGGEIFLD